MASHHVRCRTEQSSPQKQTLIQCQGGPEWRGDASTSALWTVRDIRHWGNPSYTRVVIDVDGEVQYRFGRLINPDRLYVDLIGAQLAPPTAGRSLDVSDRYLKGVRGAQNQAGVVRVVLDLKTLGDFHVFTMTDPYRLLIDIKGTGSGTAIQSPRHRPHRVNRQQRRNRTVSGPISGAA